MREETKAGRARSSIGVDADVAEAVTRRAARLGMSRAALVAAAMHAPDEVIAEGAAAEARRRVEASAEARRRADEEAARGDG